MLLRKVFGRTTIFGGWCLLWCELTGRSSFFPKYPFGQLSIFLLIHLFKSYCALQNSSDDLCVFLLYKSFFYELPKAFSFVLSVKSQRSHPPIIELGPVNQTLARQHTRIVPIYPCSMYSMANRDWGDLL